MFDPISLLVQIAVALAIQTIAYVLTPKPKGPKPEAVKQLENPTAEAGKPVAVPFGTVWITEPNILWFGDKSSRTSKVRA